MEDADDADDDDELAVFSEELVSDFGMVAEETETPTDNANANRIGEEQHRWLVLPLVKVDSVLKYWQRLAESNTFGCLPQAARVVYSVPMLSAQIERDFGRSGRTVINPRTSMNAHDIDMVHFC